MRKRIFSLLITILILNICYSQKSKILNDCEIISIDTTSYYNNYYIIKAKTEKGIIVMFSYYDKKVITKNIRGVEKIKKKRKYDFEVIMLDSILIKKNNTEKYETFPNFRGGNGRFVILGNNDNIILEFEDYNYKPFKPLNLSGLYYIKLK